MLWVSEWLALCMESLFASSLFVYSQNSVPKHGTSLLKTAEKNDVYNLSEITNWGYEPCLASCQQTSPAVHAIAPQTMAMQRETHRKTPPEN